MNKTNIISWTATGAIALAYPIVGGTLIGGKLLLEANKHEHKKKGLALGLVAAGIVTNIFGNMAKDFHEFNNQPEPYSHPLVEHKRTLELAPIFYKPLIAPSKIDETYSVELPNGDQITQDVKNRTPEEFLDDVINQKKDEIAQIRTFHPNIQIQRLELQIDYLSQ